MRPYHYYNYAEVAAALPLSVMLRYWRANRGSKYRFFSRVLGKPIHHSDVNNTAYQFTKSAEDTRRQQFCSGLASLEAITETWHESRRVVPSAPPPRESPEAKLAEITRIVLLSSLTNSGADAKAKAILDIAAVLTR